MFTLLMIFTYNFEYSRKFSTKPNLTSTKLFLRLVIPREHYQKKLTPSVYAKLKIKIIYYSNENML